MKIILKLLLVCCSLLQTFGSTKFIVVGDTHHYSPSPSFKESILYEIALEAIKSELTLAQISSKYGVHTTQIKAWKKQALALLPDIFSDKKKQAITQHETQVAELYEQIGRLKVENDFLKKKSKMFC